MFFSFHIKYTIWKSSAFYVPNVPLIIFFSVVLWLRLDMEEESKMLTTEDDGDNSTGSEITNYHNYWDPVTHIV